MRLALAGCILWSATAWAQFSGQEPQTAHWEVGALGGLQWNNDLTVKNATGSATTGLKWGGTVGVFGGDDMYDRLSGEVRYLYQFSDLKLSSGNTSITFGGHTHIGEGALLWHFRGRKSHIRPFFAFGGGIKVLEGTGQESAGQPLAKFAALTATREMLPTADVGFGFKIALREHIRLRVEVRDYISASPSKVIAAAPGAAISGVLNGITGLGGFSFYW